ncbi:sigma-54-dependent Fis family transcriptional regulator [Neptuniibacter sp.]|uniref:sigma-54 interaction domain-containing protein n=1 Tax=Neptuniibacter sp. TaxID=1962643 RepID=UPI0026191D68|nr:sigma-54-dependent Fis family transcriptional regulator [Neptuniibacter sp.]
MEQLFSSIPELSALLEAFSQPAAVLSDEYQILATNKAYQEHHSSETELVSRHCYQVSHGYAHPCDQEGESCPLKRCQQTGSRQRVLHLHNTPFGQEHVDVEMLPLPHNEGQPRYYLEIMHLVKVAQATPEGQGLIGSSPAFNKMVSLIQRAGPSEISVLLLGESGTGKELVAKGLHNVSGRAQAPFVTVECSGLSETLFESEMFGHEKGAFTGAINRKEGLVSAARGGTLFLDEVGDIPLSLQVKLLRLIETGTYRTVGGLELKHADFRLICATHKKLKQMVEMGEFRQDLFYRISTFPIELPALRERKTDIPLLILALLQRLPDTEAIKVSSSALAFLKNYSFPGNIRELRNILERAVLLSDDGVINVEHLPDECRMNRSIGSIPPFVSDGKLIPLAELESVYLSQVKNAYSGRNRELADALGVSERTLYRKLQGL